MTLSVFQRWPAGSNRLGEGGKRLSGFVKTGTTDLPLITVITAVYNGLEKLEGTIQRIVNQTYPNLEFIIVDGGSTDGTLDLLKKYDDQIDYWVSEKDQGISDAFNRGVQLSTGKYINFQGDGDGFTGPDALERLFDGVGSSAQFICGNIQRVSMNDEVLFTSQVPTNFNKQSLLFKMSLPHQALFTHRSFFEKYGLFDIQASFAMDYEHLLRAYHDFPEVLTKDVTVAIWRADGVGQGRVFEVLSEYDRIKRRNGVASPLVLDMIHEWSKFKEVVKNILGKPSV